mmetsp:Transcript_30884/g.72072  ORF Transcript_30884/g.72072 Transcript_30884/m.72072 type:complete len:193 (-) Transcript_30884:154-732(-)
MGTSLAAARRHVLGRKDEIKVVMMGLDAAGKTSIAYRLKMGEGVITSPAAGFNIPSYHYFNVETIEHKGVSITLWDICGQEKMRESWRHFCEGARGIIFVVDGSDRDRLEIAREELHRLLADSNVMKDAAVLVYVSKRDLHHALSGTEVAKKLELHKCPEHAWHVQESCALSGEGLFEGLRWLLRSVMHDKL